jgi:hypothetical protein
MRYFYSTMTVHFWNPGTVLLCDILLHYDGPFLKSRDSAFMRYLYSTMTAHFWNPEKVLLWDISNPLWRSIFEIQKKCFNEIILHKYGGPFLIFKENVLLWDQLHYDGPFLNSREIAPMRYFYFNMAVHFWNPEKMLLWDISTPIWRSIFDIQRMCSYEI